MENELLLSPEKRRLLEIIRSSDRIRVDANLWKSAGIKKATGYRTLRKLASAGLISIRKISPRETYVEATESVQARRVISAGRLEDSIIDDRKRALLAKIKAHCRELWKRDTSLLFHPVAYGYEHTESVVQILDRLLRKYMKSNNRLNQSEILVLLSAAWLHDIGYFEVGESEDFGVIRHTHHLKSYSHIMNNIDICGGFPFAPLIALVTKAHRDVPLKEDEYEDNAVESDRVRIQFLSALLKLADNLSFSSRIRLQPSDSRLRTLKEKLGYIPLQLMRHYYTTGVSLDSEIRKDNVDIKIHIHSIIPSKEYSEYFVEPWIVRPIQRAVIDTFHAFLKERLIVDTSVGSTYTLAPSVDRIPEDAFSEFRQRVVHGDSLRNLLQYNYRRIYKYLEPDTLSDRTSESNVIRVRNEVSYDVFNNSDHKQWLSGNGTFLRLTAGFPEGKPLDPKSMQDFLNFNMSFSRGQELMKPAIIYSPWQSEHSEIPPEELRNKLMRKHKIHVDDSVIARYSLTKLVDSRKTHLQVSFVYLNPIPPGDVVGFKYSWHSHMLPWDSVALILTQYTKGLVVTCDEFPKSYRFSTLATLLKAQEMYTDGITQIVTQHDVGQATTIRINEMLAPGTSIFIELKDSSMTLRKKK